MDKPAKGLHYPNMNKIPIYALYGEETSQQDWLHWETIEARSRLHDFRIAPHRHEQFFQLLSFAGGRAQVVLDGAATDLRPPALVVVPALTVHGYEFSPNVEGVVVTLMERDVIAAGLPMPEAMVLRDEQGELAEALDRLIREADRPGTDHDTAMRAHLTLLLVGLRRAQKVTSMAGDGVDRARLHVQAFRYLVDQRFRQTRRIADYASDLGISPTHLNRSCRQVLGASAFEVIERRIALEARRQLLFSSLSIKQIGAELGYDDPAYFTRFATRKLGMSPSALREQAGRV